MAKVKIPQGLTEKKEVFDFLVKNRALIVAEKKHAIKWADEIAYPSLYVNARGEVTAKAELAVDVPGQITRQLVINTTNLMDSHDDVHIPGLWKKTIKDNKNGFYLLQEHKMEFEKVIAEGCAASTQMMSWKSLGAAYSGETEALVFNATILQKRNPFMYGQYNDGFVKQHSVGMQYVIIELAINDEDYKAEYATWNKYINQVANKQDAEDNGYFFPVLEAKISEGSAVLKGSNWVTPTLGNKSLNTDEGQPGVGPTDEEQPFDVSAAIKQTNFLTQKVF